MALQTVGERVAHATRENVMASTGKTAVHGFVEGVMPHQSSLHIATGALSGWAFVPGVLVALGLTTALSSALMQMDYGHKRNAIRRFYEDEIAAKLGKSASALKHQDLHKIAEGDDEMEKNHTIAEAVAKARRQRNFGIGMSIVASLATLTLTSVAFSHGLAAGAAMTGAWKIASAVASGVVGLLVYKTIKTGLHWASDKIFGIDEPTTHDRIVAIEKDRAHGRAITREQVLSVFVSANEELNSLITSAYRKPYDRLAPDLRRKIAADIAKIVPLDHLADAITHKKMNAAELAFTVEGQVSGYVPDQAPPPEKKGLFGMVKEFLTGSGKKKPPAEAPELTTLPPPPHADNEAPAKSFVERFTRKPVATELGHVAQIEQQRALAAQALPQR